MKRLPRHEETPEKQAYADYLSRWNKNHKISYVLITVGVFFLFGFFIYWLKRAGIIFSF